MQEVEHETIIDVGDETLDVMVIAEFTPAIPQGTDGDGGRAESVKIESITDNDSYEWVELLGDEELETIREEILATI